jgi:DNA mismatch repair ATPase MutS
MVPTWCLVHAGADSRPQLRGSLLHLLDRCSTAAGLRMLRRWLAAPLADRAGIIDRQQAVQVGTNCASVAVIGQPAAHTG